MKFKFLIKLFIGISLLVGAHANAGLITKDYSSVGDGLITEDTIGQREWLDVSIFVGMNFGMLQGSNIWTANGFHLASDDEVFALLVNAGTAQVVDQLGSLDYSVAHTTQTYANYLDLYNKLGGGAANFNNNTWIHGIISDDDADGLSNLARMTVPGTNNIAVLNGNGDQWGPSKIQSHSQVGAWFVRDVADVPEPSTLAIFALGLMGLASRRFKKQS